MQDVEHSGGESPARTVISRRRFIGVAGAALGGGLLIAAGCGSDDTGAPAGSGEGQDAGYAGKVAVILLTQVLPAAPFVVAQEKGYFDEASLDLELVSVDGGSATVQTIESTTKIGMSGTLPALIAYSKGVTDLRLVAGFVGDSPIVFLALSDSGIDSPQDLEGKKIGITSAGSLTDYFARALAERNGLTVGENVELVPVGSPADTATAVRQGVIDVGWSTPPFSTQIIGSGEFQLVSDTADLTKTYSNNSLIATQDFIDERPEALKAWIGSLGKAIDLIRTDPADAGTAWSAGVDSLEPEIATTALEQYGKLFSLDFNRAGILAAGESGKEVDQLDTVPPLDEIIATGFLPPRTS